MTNDALTPMSKNDLITYYANYSGDQTKNDKGNFTMSNSVFVNNPNYNGTGTFTPYIAVTIGSENIYTKDKDESKMTEKELADLNKIREAKAIDIYVERVCAKVYVDAQPSFEGYFVDKDGTETQIPVLINNNGTSVEKKITIIPEFQGIGLSVTTKNARLIKNLPSTLTYSFTTAITDFQWNDVKNKRTYWETAIGSNSETTGGGFSYTKWSDLNNPWDNNTSAKYIEYVNPNTSASTTYDQDEATKNTKLLVRAQLKYVPEGETNEQPLDLVKFSGGYWMADYLLFHAANQVVKHLAHIEEFLPEGLTADQVTAVKKEIGNLIADGNETDGKINIKKKLSLVRLTENMKDAYLAKLSILTKEEKYPDLLPGLTDTALKSKVATVVNEQVQSTLDDITNRQIQYWKNGQTYFYIPIRHLGITGLTSTNYLNAVVRNHVYKVNITKIWGLGTPVIEPGDPIDPERPEDAPDSYMTAKINVLKWRVVSSNVVMH